MFPRWFGPLAAVVLTAATLAGCSDTLEQFAGPTMGSTYSVKYVRSSQAPTVEEVRSAVDDILSTLDRQVSTYRSDSDLQRFNALPAGQCLAMPPSVVQLTAFGQSLAQRSAGAFDLTLEPLLNLWGFGPQSRGQQVPDAAAIAGVLQQIGLQHVRIEGEQLCKDIELQLEFNSIAAGYAVDQVSAYLRSQGIHNYLVEITGELQARGHKPDGSSWRIGVEAPREDRQVAQQVLNIDGWSVSTSGDYRNYYEENGVRLSHTLDPRTGHPVSHALAAVTVLHESALQADGLSTLLMVLGPEQGLAYAEKEQLAALFVSRVKGEFVSQASSVFTQRFATEEN